jgi:hypothetical protein
VLIKTISDVYNLVRKRELSVLDAVEVALRQARRGRRWHGVFHVEGLIGGRPFAQVCYNQLLNHGEQDILEAYFGGAAVPADFKLGMLKTTYAIVETDALATVVASELVPAEDPGYSPRKTVDRSLVAGGWPTRGLDGNGDWFITSEQVVWTATAPWTNRAGFLFLMNGGTTAPGNNTGRITAIALLSPTRLPEAANDIIRAQYTVTLR